MASFIACIFGGGWKYALEVDSGVLSVVMMMLWKKRGWKSAEVDMLCLDLVRHAVSQKALYAVGRQELR
jgi:hypothetical protein